MSSKVKCTCGWSWNKSDSSKKDMYVCHECGRDNSNNMKNGGWLDNYNDSEVSLPEGYVGEGYDTSGRDYSPAWGGQFEDGGFIPMAQNGRATRADSLDVYNRALKIDAYYENLRKKGWYPKREIIPTRNLTSEDLEDEMKSVDKESRETYKKQSKQGKGYSILNNMYPNADPKKANLNALAEHIKLTRGTRYASKDNLPSIIDPMAPTTVIDTRIIPKERVEYGTITEVKVDEFYKKYPNPTEAQKNKFYKELEKLGNITPPSGSAVNLYRYDPLSVKPWDMLTDAEKKLRVQKYGTDGVPKSYLSKTSTKETDKPVDVKPQLQPRVEALNLRPIEQTPINIPVQELDFNTPIKAPKSYNVSSQRTNVNGINDFYNNVQQGVDYEQALKSKQASDAYNKYIQEKYGNEDALKNPKAVERLKQLKQNVEIVPQYQMGGKLTFLQPTSEKLPQGYRIPYADPSSELAMSIGGENGEPAYLIPSFKYGRPLENPMEEFKKTGEHLGGPFKTWQEADQWEQEVRHPYVEKGQAIPMPIKTWGEMAMGGSIPGSVGFTYARTNSPAPSNGKYAKKTMASAQEGKTITVDEGDGKKRKILTDSKEYADLFNQGKIGVKNDDESISMNPLNEVVVTPYDKQYPFYQELSDEEKKYFNSDSPIGRQIRSKAQDNVGFNADKATDFAMGWLRDLPLAGVQAPQSAFVEGVEAIRGNDYNFLDAITPGEQRLPSDVWGIENDYYGVNPLNPMLPPINYKTVGNTSMDIVTDPLLIEGLARQPLQKGIRQLGNIKTSVAPELQQGLHSNGFFDFFKRKPKSDYPKYRLVTDEDLPISSFNKASKEQIKAMQESNIYKDLAKSESRRHQDLMRNIEEYGEGWKYTDEEIANSAKQADDAKANWSNYIDAQEAGIKTNPKFFDNTTDNLVFYKGKDLGKEELQQLAKQEPDQWYGIQGYKETRPNVKGYISDEADYIHSTKYRLPGNRWDTEAMLRDMSKDAEQSFKSYYKNQNWKPNIDDIPLNKQGGVIKDDRGQWDHPGEITEIGSNQITMQGVPYPVLGVSDEGDVQMMYPEEEYKFKGKKVTEFPMAKNGIRQEQKGLVNLDQLTNFTNYNTKQPGGWMDKYQ